jgi:TonB family protein
MSFRPRQRGWKITAVVVLAVVLHVGLLALGHTTAVLLGWGKGSGGFKYRPFELTLQKTSEDEDPVSHPRQVVSIPPPEREEKPIKAKYSSEFDSRVKTETKARHRKAARVLTNRSARQIQKKGPSGLGSKGGRSDVRKTHRDVERSVTKGRTLLSMRESKRPGDDVEPLQPKGNLKAGGKKQQKKQLTMSDLRPSNKILSKAIGAAFPDALPGVREGDKTLLNTKRWRFASFFNRVKAAVAQHWNPAGVYRRHDPTGNVYGFKSRLTVLKVWLYPDGRLKRILLQHPCGLSFLDNEAVRAFRAAAPFPNPPRRLVDKQTNLIHFSFGFIFEIIRGPVFRIFRYR